jgi:hypothetical protein
MIEAALYTVLSSSASITALAGSRIYPAVLPTDPTLPALTYMFIGGTVYPIANRNGIQRSRVQIDCWGNSYSDAVTLRQAVVQTLAGYSGPSFQSQIIQTHDDFDHDLQQYRAVVEVYVLYSL